MLLVVICSTRPGVCWHRGQIRCGIHRTWLSARVPVTLLSNNTTDSFRRSVSWKTRRDVSHRAARCSLCGNDKSGSVAVSASAPFDIIGRNHVGGGSSSPRRCCSRRSKWRIHLWSASATSSAPAMNSASLLMIGRALSECDAFVTSRHCTASRKWQVAGQALRPSPTVGGFKAPGTPSASFVAIRDDRPRARRRVRCQQRKRCWFRNGYRALRLRG
jgi:hypothetical protein